MITGQRGGPWQTGAGPLLVAALKPAELRGAACAGRYPEWDHDLDGETAAERRKRVQSAIKVCTGCEARPQCAAIAAELPLGGRLGVWAGLDLGHGS